MWPLCDTTHPNAPLLHLPPPQPLFAHVALTLIKPSVTPRPGICEWGQLQLMTSYLAYHF